MRCESCRKFVSYEGDEEPRLEQHDLNYEPGDDKATVTVSITLTKRCAECSTDLASTEFEIEDEVPIPEEHIGHVLSIEIEEPTQTERYQTTSINRKTGKVIQIRNPRYQKHLYGVEANYTITCDEDGCEAEEKTISGTISDECMASSLESLS